MGLAESSNAARRSASGSSSSTFIANRPARELVVPSSSRRSTPRRGRPSSPATAACRRMRGPAAPSEEPQRLERQPAHPGVAGVREGDDTQPRRRVPAHVRAEARVAAAVADEPAERRGRRSDEQPEAVPGRTGASGAASADVQESSGGIAAWACCISRRDARRRGWRVVRVVARRERVGEPADPAGEVADGRPDAAHRGERAVAVDGLLQPGVGAADVAGRPQLGRDRVGVEGGAAGRAARAAGRGPRRRTRRRSTFAMIRPRIA